MNCQQLVLFPGEAFPPREPKSPTRLFVCAVCQDTGKLQPHGPIKAPRYCQCAAGQTAQSRAALETLPESKRTKRLRELYVEPRDTTGQCLREALLIDNPAMRLTTQGPQALTLIELLSFVLGTPNDPAAAGHLLAELKTLTAIKARSVKELAAVKHGMTMERARRLLAALELGDRLRLPREERPLIKSPADAAVLVGDMATLEQEQLRVLVLDTKNKVLHIATVYQGSVHTTVIRVGELFKAAVRMNATAIIVAHNHPSGDPTPSTPEDVAVTREIVQAAKLLDIDFLDHLVIGEAGRFTSLKERGLGF